VNVFKMSAALCRVQ